MICYHPSETHDDKVVFAPQPFETASRLLIAVACLECDDAIRGHHKRRVGIVKISPRDNSAGDVELALFAFIKLYSRLIRRNVPES